ncbi:olfactory receptor 6M1-like [Apteryx mantelli]|uniref:Olfactory receptor 6M1-like n=1 Tax=Apteryx mantelli TaxID=2696672 RepID=A0ABM4G847_9AVES
MSSEKIFKTLHYSGVLSHNGDCTEMENGTSVTEFILARFPNVHEVEILLLVVFLLIYLVTVLGNTLIIVVVYTDGHLHSPMYYFLSYLSFREISMTSSVVPEMLANFLSEKKTISFDGCFSQLFFSFLMGTTESILFAVTSYDTYVAVCNPLRYPSIMTSKVCSTLVLGCWAGAFVMILSSLVLAARLPYCGANVIDHYFCDSAPLLHLACADIQLIEWIDFVVSWVLLLGSLALTVLSYAYIDSNIFRMPSAQGRQKAFATCASHFTVVSLGFGISIFVYARPSHMTSVHLNKSLPVVSSIVAPLVNPFIFSLRKEQMKEALKNALHKGLVMTKRAGKPRASSWLVLSLEKSEQDLSVHRDKLASLDETPWMRFSGA